MFVLVVKSTLISEKYIEKVTDMDIFVDFLESDIKLFERVDKTLDGINTLIEIYCLSSFLGSD